MLPRRSASGSLGELCSSLLSLIYSFDNSTRFFFGEPAWPAQISVVVIDCTCMWTHDPGWGEQLKFSPGNAKGGGCLLGIQVVTGVTSREWSELIHLESSSILNRLIKGFLLSGVLELPWLLSFTRLSCFSLDSLSSSKSIDCLL